MSDMEHMQERWRIAGDAVETVGGQWLASARCERDARFFVDAHNAALDAKQAGTAMTKHDANEEPTTLRQRYAGTAPSVPDWFLCDDPSDPAPEVDPDTEGWKKLREWEMRHEERRFFAWRWAYADAMLAHERAEKGGAA